MPQLIFYIESGYPQIYNLLTRKTTVGRNDDNDISFNDPRVSDYHSEIVKIESGSYQLTDLDSDNGTAVNGKLIDEMILKGGDQIKFGPVNAAFVDQSESTDDKLLRQTVEKDLESKSERLARIEDAIEDRTKVLNAIPDSKSTLEVLENAMADLARRHETERNNLQAIKSELQSCQKKRIDLQSELNAQEKELEELGKDRAELQHQYRRVHTANETSERLKEELHAELEKLRIDIERERALLEENRAAHGEAQAVIEKARMIRARMAELEVGLNSREASYEEFGKKIAKRENSYEKLGEEITGRTHELEELNRTIESKRKNAADLSRLISKNNDLIRSSSEMLENMESTLQKEIDEVSLSQETQKSMSRENLSLSHLISGKTAVLNRLSDKFNASKNGTEEVVLCPHLRIINPAMRSLIHYFHNGAGIPGQDRVNPVGYYGLAACTKGSMHREADTIPAGNDPVLVLLHGEHGKDKALIESISRDMPDRILLVCWREGQLDALTAEQEHAPDPRRIIELLGSVSGIISVDSRTAELIDQLHLGRPHLNLTLPCPVEFPEWNSPVPTSSRSRGVFVSVNGFDPDSPLHRGRIDLLNQLVVETQTTVTLYHPNPVPDVMEGLTIPAELITEIAAPMKYSECLGLMREHHFVTGFGKNQDGGHQIGDAILSRSIFIGADFNSVTDQLLFPESCIKGGDIERALKNAHRLLTDPGAYLETVEQAQSLAVELISFETVRVRLSEFFSIISANPASSEDDPPIVSPPENRAVHGRSTVLSDVK